MKHRPPFRTLFRATAFAAALGAVVLSAGPSVAQKSFPDPFTSVVQAAEQVTPAIVTLEVEIPEAHPAARILGTERTGTGVIVASNGYILTASYIIMGGRRIRVTLTDGRSLSGRVHKIDYSSGLGLVRVDVDGLPTAPLGRSRDLRIGQMAISIGSRGEAERVVHHGLVSAIRPFTAPWEFFLDRAIYTTAMTSGYFGGTPLLDARGRVIGIVSLNVSQQGGMGMAIPIDLFTAVREDLLDLQRDERRRLPWLGVQTIFIEDLLLVRNVTPKGPAALSGVLPRDLIREINGRPVKSQADFYRAIWRHRIGDPIQLTIKRSEQIIRLHVPGGDREAFFR